MDARAQWANGDSDHHRGASGPLFRGLGLPSRRIGFVRVRLDEQSVVRGSSAGTAGTAGVEASARLSISICQYSVERVYIPSACSGNVARRLYAKEPSRTLAHSSAGLSRLMREFAPIRFRATLFVAVARTFSERGVAAHFAPAARNPSLRSPLSAAHQTLAIDEITSRPGEWSSCGAAWHLDRACDSKGSGRYEIFKRELAELGKENSRVAFCARRCAFREEKIRTASIRSKSALSTTG